MINTIFYYPDSLTFEEYQSRLNNNDIAARTIVFADAQKAIYKGGRQFGATSLSDLKTQIEQIFSENPYIRASKDSYGIVKIGNGINVTDGVISVDFSNVDLSEVEGDIASLKASVALHTNAITDLTGRMSSAEATLTTKASASDVTSLSSRVGTTESTLTDLSAQTTLFARSLTDLTTRMASAETGLTAKADASNVYTKTQIDGKITTINEMISSLSGGAELDLSAITDLENGLAQVRASLAAKANASETYTKTYIDGKFTTIETTLSTLGASSGVDTSAITDLVNRMSAAESALTSKANASETYTKTEVDGKISTVETQMTNLGSSSGLSNIAITDLKNRMSSAESSLTSKANASNVYTKTEIDGKFTAVNATLETLGAESGVDTSAITDLTNRVAAAETSLSSKADSNVVYTKTEIDGKITTINSTISANSGLKTAADVKSAFSDDGETIYTSGTASATLFAKIKSDADAAYAGIDAVVKKDSNGKITSDIILDSDHVTITAGAIEASGAQLTANQVTVVGDNNKNVAQIRKNGSANFMNGNILFKSAEFGNQEDGIAIFHSNPSVDQLTFYQAGSLAFETKGGTVRAGIWASPNDSHVLHIDSGYSSMTLSGNDSANAAVTINTGKLVVTNGSGGAIELRDILFVDGNDSNSLTYDGADDTLECGANLDVSGDCYIGGNISVGGSAGWSGTITIDGNTLTFTEGILTGATGTGVTAAS